VSVQASEPIVRDGQSETRRFAEQAFSRTAGAPLVLGNGVRLLKDATENYPAWLDAIRSAQRTIHFESYIIHEDDAGAQFARALSERAQAGVRVRVLYDWMGGVGKASRRFWRALREAGVEVRCFNPPRLDSPFGWISRDHRKMIAVDGRVGFVTGLCVGRMWVGDPARGIAPWRDTGVEVRGPALADIEEAFAEAWAAAGEPMPPSELPAADQLSPAGDISLRVVGSVPNMAGVYRLDQLIAAMARRSLWLTDAYFVGVAPYVQALRAASLDGVDVRLLVPGSTDIPTLRPLSRAGYRPLLEAGIRVFEWNGPMLHAKTAVADGRWSRVGSSNLNPASWLGNWELDVVVEDEGFGAQMERMYDNDLGNATEIVLGRHRVRATTRPPRARGWGMQAGGSASRAAAGAIRVANSVGAAMTSRRTLGHAEAELMIGVGLGLLLLCAVAVVWPRIVAFPLAAIGAWLAVSLFVTAYRLKRIVKKERQAEAVRTGT
jgi:cardiolipin synthase